MLKRRRLDRDSMTGVPERTSRRPVLPTVNVSQRQRRWALVLSISCFVLSVDALVVSSGWLVADDGHAWLWFAERLGTRGFQVVEGISLAGVVPNSSRYLMVAAVLGTTSVAALFYRGGMRVSCALLLVNVVGVGIVVRIVKSLIHRQGRSLTPWMPVGHTFPSGTAAVAVTFFGFLGYIVYQRNRGWQAHALCFTCLLAAMAFIVSAATYHYPTEVVGGIATGLAWLSAVQIVFWNPLRRELFYRRSAGHRFASEGRHFDPRPHGSSVAGRWAGGLRSVSIDWYGFASTGRDYVSDLHNAGTRR